MVLKKKTKREEKSNAIVLRYGVEHLELLKAKLE
jgi:hypothetical protein